MKTDELYRSLPPSLQSLAVTLRGIQLRKYRYTSYTWERLRFLRESERWSESQHTSYQVERLRALVSHAVVHSPYYRERYKSLGLSGNDVKSIDDLQILPILEKEDFRKNNELCVSTHTSKNRMWKSFTSGTTGMPLSAYHTHTDMQERVAHMERLYRWYNPRPFRRRASFTGKLVADPSRQEGPFSRANIAIRQRLFSSHHLRPENLRGYIRELAECRPEQVDGIASPIFAIGDYLCRSGKAGQVQPAVVIPTSETIWPHIRSRIEEGFQAPVADQYGSQEGAPVAGQCPDGGFHIFPESGIFEILDAEGSPCSPGVRGRLVVTSFLSTGTPLIRYDIGDVSWWVGSPCSCGRQMPLLGGIEGRWDDMFFTAERGIVPRIDSALKSLPASIIATQVAQVGMDRFELRIQPDRELFSRGHAESIVEHLHDYLGGAVSIEVRVLEEIQRTPGGKLRVMVNECDEPEVTHAIQEAWNRSNLTA